ncbi:nuclear receptor VDR-b [Ciona intestinalis]
MHFGAITCEGCKGFFRRSVKKNASFSCAFEKKCEINKNNRKHCQACRFNACLAAGMNSSLILSDEEVNKKRDLIRMNREKRSEQQNQKKHEMEKERLKKLQEIGSKQPQATRMTMDEKLLVETLLKGHRDSYDFAYVEYDTFRGREQITAPDKPPSSPKTSLAWLVASLSKNQDMEAEYVAMNSTKNTTDKTDEIDGKVDEARGEATAEDAATKETNATPPVFQQPENSDVFSSLHGTANDAADVTVTTKIPGSNGGQQEMGNNGENPNALDAATAVEAQSTTEDSGDLSYLRGLLRSQGFSIADDSKAKQLFQHFCDIMTWGIRKVIDYCKGIPQFVQLSIVDQIVLLRGGCLEMLVLRSYFAFSCNENKYMSDKFQYKPSDFLQAGGNKEFVEKYNSLHIRMRKMKLQVEEICLLLALVLFSPDRPGLEDQAKVEQMQDCVANTLQAYEYTHKPPNEARTMYCELLLILPILRTINMLFAQNIMSLKQTNEKDMNPLILEVNNSADDED